VKKLFANVPVLDTGARGSTTTFVQRGIGDVLLAWENEAYLALNELGPGQVEIVTPSLSILAEPPGAVVAARVDGGGTREVAQTYLDYQYSEVGQEIAAHNYYRPRHEDVAARHAGQFANVNLFTIYEVFGAWNEAPAQHFGDGGLFNQIYAP